MLSFGIRKNAPLKLVIQTVLLTKCPSLPKIVTILPLFVDNEMNIQFVIVHLIVYHVSLLVNGYAWFAVLFASDLFFE